MNLFAKQERTPAQTVVQEVCRVKKGESLLIVANPETTAIAQELFTAALEVGAKPVLMFQQKKPSMEAAEPAVIGALKSEPDVFFSISQIKLGKDKEAIAHPYIASNGEKYDHIFDYLLHGKKTMRSVWTPGLTEDMFNRTVNIDYKLLAERCVKLCKKYENADNVHVTSPNGTDVVISVKGRKGLCDNGDFSTPGSGGNIPAGEVFISPVVGATNGKIVFDGSMTFSDGDALLGTPICATVVDGYVKDISGGEEAKRLLKDVSAAEKEALVMEKNGKLPAGQGAVYSRNARNIGELGIGLNPAANITGNMLQSIPQYCFCINEVFCLR